jgi:hypothetical protein
MRRTKGKGQRKKNNKCKKDPFCPEYIHKANRVLKVSKIIIIIYKEQKFLYFCGYYVIPDNLFYIFKTMAIETIRVIFVSLFSGVLPFFTESKGYSTAFSGRGYGKFYIA